MNFRSLVERVVRDAQADFASILERKLAVLLAGDVTATPSAGRPPTSRKAAPQPTRASRGLP